VNRGESPEIDLNRPIKGGHVSRDYPFREIKIVNSGVPLTRDRALVLISPEGNKTVVL
jgi:hypothetical protein